MAKISRAQNKALTKKDIFGKLGFEDGVAERKCAEYLRVLENAGTIIIMDDVVFLNDGKTETAVEGSPPPENPNSDKGGQAEGTQV